MIGERSTAPPAADGARGAAYWSIAGLYLLGLGLLVFTPINWALNRLTVRLYVLFRYDLPIAPDWVGPEHYGDLLNVLLFVPFGVLLMAWCRRVWQAALVGVLVSAAVELVQALPAVDRQPSVVDVVCNGLGALLGAWAHARWQAVRAARRGSRR